MTLMLHILNLIFAANRNPYYDECGQFDMKKLNEELNQVEFGIYTEARKREIDQERNRRRKLPSERRHKELLRKREELEMEERVVYGSQRDNFYEIYDVKEGCGFGFLPNTIPCPNNCWCELFPLEDCSKCGSHEHIFMYEIPKSDRTEDKNRKLAKDLSKDDLIKIIALLQDNLVSAQQEVKRCHRNNQ